jgi:hypothetical protein
MSQITGGVHRGHAAGDTNIEKAASQLVSDTKYEVKRALGSDVVSKMAPAALMKAYIQQLNKSESGPVKALAQKKLTGGSMKEDFNIDALASSSVANALFKVFVEGVEKKEYVLGEEYLEELRKMNKDGEPLYSVKVFYKNGTTYVRWSSRDDMSRIRSNPNVKSIEMVDYAPPQDQQGSRSSKKDYDGDGKVESGAKEHAGSVHNAIQRKRGGTPDGRDTSSVREDVDFFEEGKKKDKKRQFNVMRGSNTERITMFPESGKIATSVAKKVAEETACDSSKPERDMRGDYAKTNLIKNKLRSALGVKNPIVMVTDEEDVKEGLGLSVGASKVLGKVFSNTRTPEAPATKAAQKNITDPIGNAVKNTVRTVLGPANNSPEAQKARREKRLPEQIELESNVVSEEGSTADDVFASVKKGMDPKSILGSRQQKEAQAEQNKKQKSKPKRKLKGYSIPGDNAGGNFRKAYND